MKLINKEELTKAGELKMVVFNKKIAEIGDDVPSLYDFQEECGFLSSKQFSIVQNIIDTLCEQEQEQENKRGEKMKTIEFKVEVQTSIDFDKMGYKIFKGMSNEAQKSFLFDQIELCMISGFEKTKVTEIIDLDKRDEIAGMISFVDSQFNGFSNLSGLQEFLKEITNDNAHLSEACDIEWNDETEEFIIYDYSNGSELSTFSFEEMKGIIDKYEI